MVSSLGRTASDTPVRDGGERKRSDSGEQMLICARKSRADEVGLADVAQGSGATKSRGPVQRECRGAVEPVGVVRPAQKL
jgi:hypothetical protein